MAKKTDAEQKKDEQNLELRKALNGAYAALEGQRSLQSFSALTVEDLLDQQIERIEGKDTEVRPNVLNRVTKTVSDVTQSVAKIKALPDDYFVEPDATKDVNTPPDVLPDDEVL